MTDKAKRAVAEWKAGHLAAEGLTPLGGGYHRQHPYVVFYSPDDEMPYSVQYAGSGKYFPDVRALIVYLVGRGWDIPDLPEEV